MKECIGAVIFDFDGVILDSANIKTEAFLELFSEYPQHQQAIQEYHIEHQGITRYKKFEWIYTQLLHEPYTQATKKQLGKEFSNLVFKKIMKCDPMPGVIEFLESLQNTTPTFIASGTPDEELERILNNRNLAKYFEAAYGSNISKEEAIDKIAKDKSLEYSNLLFVGDATTDWRAAKAVGVSFVAVYSDEMKDYWQERDIKVVKNLMEIHERFNMQGSDFYEQ